MLPTTSRATRLICHRAVSRSSPPEPGRVRSRPFHAGGAPMAANSGRPTVVVAYSGGLDTSFLVARAARQGQRVVAATIDTGGFDDEELRAIELRAKALGADTHVVVDARQDVFDRYVSYLIKGNVLKG